MQVCDFLKTTKCEISRGETRKDSYSFSLRIYVNCKQNVIVTNGAYTKRNNYSVQYETRFSFLVLNYQFFIEVFGY